MPRNNWYLTHYFYEKCFTRCCYVLYLIFILLRADAHIVRSLQRSGQRVGLLIRRSWVRIPPEMIPIFVVCLFVQIFILSIYQSMVGCKNGNIFSCVLYKLHWLEGNMVTCYFLSGFGNILNESGKSLNLILIYFSLV